MYLVAESPDGLVLLTLLRNGNAGRHEMAN